MLKSWQRLGSRMAVQGAFVAGLLFVATGCACCRADKRLERLVSPAGDATRTIQESIDRCFLSGGGTVRLAKGDWRVGGLRLRSRVTLYLESGARLIGSRDIEEYYVLEKDRIEPVPGELVSHVGWFWRDSVDKDTIWRVPGNRWNNAIIRLLGATDAAIIGEPDSVIDGQNAYDPEGEELYRGPLGVNAIGCTNLLFKGYTIKDAGNWAHRVVGTCNLRVEGVTCLAGHDSVHFNGCDGVLIENCTFKTGDDCVAGFDNRDVVVRNCYINTSCSAFRFGGTNVLVEHCTIKGPGEYGFRGKLSKEQKATGVATPSGTRNNMLSFFTYYADRTCPIRADAGKILVRDCTVENADRFLHYNYFNEQWQKGVPLTDITFERITAKGIKLPLSAWGDPYVRLSLTMKDCNIAFQKPVSEFIRGAWLKELNLQDVKVEGADGPLLRLWHADYSPKQSVRGLKGPKETVVPGEGSYDVDSI